MCRRGLSVHAPLPRRRGGPPLGEELLSRRNGPRRPSNDLPKLQRDVLAGLVHPVRNRHGQRGRAGQRFQGGLDSYAPTVQISPFLIAKIIIPDETVFFRFSSLSLFYFHKSTLVYFSTPVLPIRTEANRTRSAHGCSHQSTRATATMPCPSFGLHQHVEAMR